MNLYYAILYKLCYSDILYKGHYGNLLHSFVANLEAVV